MSNDKKPPVPPPRNPHLPANQGQKNPFLRDIIMIAATIIAAVASTSALFISGCRLLMR